MSERIRASENLLGNVTGEWRSEVHAELEVTSENGVREPSSLPGGGDAANEMLTAPAHPSNRLIAQLNDRWRVIDDPVQWILQRKKGNPRRKNSGWQQRSFCATREGLLLCVSDYCGEVDPSALAGLHALPKFHPDWERTE